MCVYKKTLKYYIPCDKLSERRLSHCSNIAKVETDLYQIKGKRYLNTYVYIFIKT